MKKIRSIIIDDEQSAREATQIMLDTFCPEIKITQTCRSVDTAVSFLDKNEIDLIFLDIEMPEKNGFELLDLIDTSKYQIIFITGYNDFAVKAFKYSACHYLLKPLLPEELINACQIAAGRIKNNQDSNQFKYLKELLEKREQYPNSIVINVPNGHEIISVDSIIRLEGERNYTWIKSTNGDYLTSKTLKEYGDILNPSKFYRIHQSHLVNRSFLKKITNKGSGFILLSDGTTIPLSRHRKKDFINWLENN